MVLLGLTIYSLNRTFSLLSGLLVARWMLLFLAILTKNLHTFKVYGLQNETILVDTILVSPKTEVKIFCFYNLCFINRNVDFIENKFGDESTEGTSTSFPSPTKREGFLD